MPTRITGHHSTGHHRTGHVTFVGAGPGDPDQLTVAAVRALATAEVVLHDRLVGQGVLDRIAPGARTIEVGKTGFGATTPQAAINALLVALAAGGQDVVRLKGGDCAVFARLDEEAAALDAAGIAYTVLPGITAASAAAAAAGRSLTRRGRNKAVRFLTGHEAEGLAEQDWRGLARPGEVAAIYMGKAAARFIQGRLLMHGADPETPVTVVENASRPDERVIDADLAGLADAASGLTGPAILLLGIAPRRRAAAVVPLREERA